MICYDNEVLIIIFAHVDVHLPDISTVSCVPSTSRQIPKFASQSNSSLLGHEMSIRSKYIPLFYL